MRLFGMGLLNPFLYSKIGVCRGIPILLIFAPKHTVVLWLKTHFCTVRADHL